VGKWGKGGVGKCRKNHPALRGCTTKTTFIDNVQLGFVVILYAPSVCQLPGTCHSPLRFFRPLYISIYRYLFFFFFFASEGQNGEVLIQFSLSSRKFLVCALHRNCIFLWARWQYRDVLAFPFVLGNPLPPTHTHIYI